jgi:tetratricopeptide (TPR) repeat protein
LASFYFKHKQYEHAIASLRTALTVERPTYRMIYSDIYYGPVWCRHMLLASYQQAGNLREAIKIMREFQQPDAPMTDALRADILMLQQKVQDAFHVYSTCLGV